MMLKVRVGGDLHVSYGSFQETKAAPGTSLCDGVIQKSHGGALTRWVKRCLLFLVSKGLAVRRQGSNPSSATA